MSEEKTLLELVDEIVEMPPQPSLTDRIRENIGSIIASATISITTVALIGISTLAGIGALYLIYQNRDELSARINEYISHPAIVETSTVAPPIATEQPTYTAVPPIVTEQPSPVIEQQFVSLHDYGYWRSSNLKLAAGVYDFYNILFETGWQVDTQCRYNQDSPTNVNIDVNFPNPRNVYLLMQAGWGIHQFANQEFGKILLGFEDGRYLQLPLVLGENIRDWARSKPDAVSTLSAPYVIQDWHTGIAEDAQGVTGGMDALAIEIPDDYQNSTLRSIQVYDTSMDTIGNVDPCIHLLGVTVEYLH